MHNVVKGGSEAAWRGLDRAFELLAARGRGPRFRLEEAQRDYETAMIARHGSCAAQEAGAESLALAAFGDRLAKLCAQIVRDTAPWADPPRDAAEASRKAIIVREMILDGLDLPLPAHRVVDAGAKAREAEGVV